MAVYIPPKDEVPLMETVTLEAFRNLDLEGINLDASLLLAVSKNHEDFVGMLIQSGASVQSKTEDGIPALQIAAILGNARMVKLLLEAGAEIEGRNNYGQTALHMAIKKEHKSVVQFLLEKGADISSRDNGGRNALHYACYTGLAGVVLPPLERGAIFETCDNEGQTPLHCAALAGNEEAVRLLLRHMDNIEVRTRLGWTALCFAAVGGYETVTRLLLEKGADFRVHNPEGRTALYLAAEKGNQGVVQILLEHGADPNTKILPGAMALFAAVVNGHEAIVKLLLDKGASVDTKDDLGGTALHRAAAHGYDLIAEILLHKGATVDAKGASAATPLHVAASRRHVAVVSVLLEYHPDIEMKDDQENTALHIAAGIGADTIMARLLARGANREAQNMDGRTPLAVAAGAGKEAAVRLMLEHGVIPDGKDDFGNTALSDAASLGHDQVVQLLLKHGALDHEVPAALHTAVAQGQRMVVSRILSHGVHIDVRDEANWRTPLYLALLFEKLEIAQDLLDHGADPSVANRLGWTPLCLMASKGNISAVKLLLQNDAHTGIDNNGGKSPLHCAVENGHQHVVRLLLRNGDYSDTKSDEALEAIELAKKYGHADVVRVLQDYEIGAEKMPGTLRTKCCKICQAIRLHRLPSEDEPALPYHANFQALRDSANTCALCSLLLDSANKLRDIITAEHYGKGAAEMQGTIYTTLPSGQSRFEVTTLGSFAPGTFNCSISDQSKEKSIPAGSQSIFMDDISVRPYLFGNWWTLGPTNSLPQLVGLGIRLGTGPEIQDAEGNTLEKVRLRGSSLRVRTDDDDLMGEIVPGRLRTFDSASPIALNKVQRWVHNCNTKHKCTPAEPKLPTRVLDIRVRKLASKIFLVEPNGQRGNYIALSHCWGSKHQIITTSSNLEARKSGILLDDLPKTFRDAVVIARKLNVQYMWIDSLCILQDSRSDWEKEASKMADVYSNSYLTIAASFSTDGEGGCFSTKIMASAAPELKSVQVSCETNTSPVYGSLDPSGRISYMAQHPFAMLESPYKSGMSLLFFSREWMPMSPKATPKLFRIGSFGRPLEPLLNQHLSSRAWTLQERLLSPRVLHYADDQIYWQCEMSFQGEDGSRFDNSSFNIDRVVEVQQLSKSGSRPSDLAVVSLIEGHSGDISTFYGKIGWLSYIEEFTRRRITVESDRLPALSGIASLIARKTGDSYYAGMWRGHFLEDLNWRVCVRETFQNMAPGGFQYTYGEKLCDPRMPKEYRAPSWSWASLEAVVKFIPLDFRHMVASFHLCETELSGFDRFGNVSSGWVKIKAPIIEMHEADPSRKPHKTEPLEENSLVELHLDCGVSLGNAYFDIKPYFPCFAMFLDSSNALVLKPIDGGVQMYTRVGQAKFMRTQSQQKGGELTLEHTPYGPISISNLPSIVVTIK